METGNDMKNDERDEAQGTLRRGEEEAESVRSLRVMTISELNGAGNRTTHM